MEETEAVAIEQNSRRSNLRPMVVVERENRDKRVVCGVERGNRGKRVVGAAVVMIEVVVVSHRMKED